MREIDTLPSAMDDIERLADRLTGGEVDVFLDYDGTLTPIVSRPEDAILPPDMKSVLARLAQRYRVAIVSGRDRADVANLVGIDGLVYAGSHGFDISGPDGLEFQHEAGRRCLPAFDAAESSLGRLLEPMAGAQIERKRFALSVHYRNAAPESVGRIQSIVGDVVSDSTGLKLTEGKMVFELRPDVAWDKGKAVAFLLDRLTSDAASQTPVYIGDDLTDEDAFAFVADRGVGIIVGDHGRQTQARWRLEDTGEVERFLARLTKPC